MPDVDCYEQLTKLPPVELVKNPWGIFSCQGFTRQISQWNPMFVAVVNKIEVFACISMNKWTPEQLSSV
jgi:hypothetical protein